MDCVVKKLVLACALGAVIEGCYASVFCEDQDGVIIYSCEDTAYCCGTSECCALENGFDLFALWYFWAFVGFGLFIIATVSGMFCKSKRHRDRVTVIDYPRTREAPDGQEADDYRQQQQQQQPRHQQVLVIPVLYNQPAPLNDVRPPPYSISGSVYPNNDVTVGAGIHPGMQHPPGPSTRRSMMEPRTGGQYSLRPRQTALPSGQFIKPLGPGYRPPGAKQYGPMPPGYVPTQ